MVDVYSQPRTGAVYNCAACEDKRQGAPYVQEAKYVAKDNEPQYWALCEEHYQRADTKLKMHYARI